MRISDWSSDVCSSDLQTLGGGADRRIIVDDGYDLYDRHGTRPRCGGDLPDGPARATRCVMGATYRCPMPRGIIQRFRSVILIRGLQRLGHAHEVGEGFRSEEHTSELQSLMRISYAVFCLKK